MPSIQDIKNPELQKLIQESAKFAAFDKEKKQQYLTKISNTTPEKEQQLIEFFTKENEKEKAALASQDLEHLKKFYEEIKSIEKKFTKLMKENAEKLSQKQDKTQMKNLLDQLNNS